MKIRSDFVTNSSSSSYCVSLSVKCKDGKEMGLDYWPEDEDGSGTIYVSLKEEKVDAVMEEIKGCSSVAELTDFLLNALDLHDLFSEIEDETEMEQDLSNDEYLTVISQALEADEDGYFDMYPDILEGVKKQNEDFQKAMAQVRTLDELESVTVHEYFTGWGEFARDGMDDFLNAMNFYQEVPDEEDLDDEDFDDEDPDEMECDMSMLTEDEMELIREHFENDSICQMDAHIDTTLTLSNGTIEKTCSLEGDTC